MSEGRGRHVYLRGPRRHRGAAAPGAVQGPLVLNGPAASPPAAVQGGRQPAARMSPWNEALSLKLNVGVLSAGSAGLNRGSLSLKAPFIELVASPFN